MHKPLAYLRSNVGLLDNTQKHIRIAQRNEKREHNKEHESRRKVAYTAASIDEQTKEDVKDTRKAPVTAVSQVRDQGEQPPRTTQCQGQGR